MNISCTYPGTTPPTFPLLFKGRPSNRHYMVWEDFYICLDTGDRFSSVSYQSFIRHPESYTPLESITIAL